MSTGYHSYPGRTDYVPEPFLNQLERNLGTGFSTGISIPILSGFSKSSNIKRMKTALVRAEANYDQKMKDIENEVYRAVRRNIAIGRQNPQYYEVLDGLMDGERVITSGYENFGDNDVLIF